VYALEAADGTEQWRFQTGDRVFSSPAVVDGTVYVGSRDGTVSALEEGEVTADGQDDTTTGEQDDSTADGQDDTTTGEQDDSTDDGLTTETLAMVGGGGTVATLLGAFLLKRRGSDDDAESPGDDSPAAPGTSTIAETNSSGTEPETTTATVDDHLDAVEAALAEARDARDRNEYDQAQTACERARKAATDARSTARTEAPDRVETVQTRLNDIDQMAAEIEADRATDHLATVENRLERDPVEDLRNRLETAESGLTTARGLVTNRRNDDLATRLETLATDLDQHRQRLDALETIRGAADDAESTIEHAEQLLEDDPDRAIEAFENSEERLETLSTRAGEHDLSETRAHLEELRRRCDTERERVETALSRVPETIPGIQRYDLSYDDIETGDPIGSGGNADVYYATAETADGETELAIKEPRMSGTLHIETVERMLAETETWQQLDGHDHIVTVVDYGAEPLPWIAMEYMDAGHVGERGAEMDFEHSLWTAIATTRAVSHAHRRGVAHLDLKPENILLRSVEGAWDVPKVADWGLSKHLLEHSKSIEGMSPHYAAPEQFDDEFGSPDDITDVYQLGAVFYELFTGRPPFEGRPTKVMRAVMDETPPLPSDIADAPTELDEVLLTALAKEKDDRYDHVLYLRDDLQDIQ